MMGFPRTKSGPCLHMVRTLYPHWGSHTAFNALGPHLRRAGWQVRDRRVPMDQGRFPISLLERYFASRSHAKGIPEFRLRDFRADLRSMIAATLGRVDVIHLLDGEHSLRGLPRWLRTLPRGRRPAVVTTLHQPPELLARLLRPEHLQYVDFVFVVSPEQEDFLNSWLPEVRVRTTLLGVDTDYFTPSGELPSVQPFICLAGGIWMRDYTALAATADRLKDKKDIQIHVVSPPAGFIPCSENIVIHRNVPDDELLRMYRGAHLLFLPLLDATANTFLMEGAACGLPVISSDRPSIRAYFPGPEANLVPGNDPAAFAAAIRGLHDDPAARCAMSAAARRRAESFSWEKVAALYQAVYREVME